MITSSAKQKSARSVLPLVAIVYLGGLLTDTPASAQQPRQALPGPAFFDTSRLAVPGAEELFLDLPSALFWTRYQSGVLGGWRYFLYPDGTAQVLTLAERPLEVAKLTCVAGEACFVRMAEGADFAVPVGQGAKPSLPQDPNLDAVLRYLAAWILAGTAPPPPVPPARALVLTVAEAQDAEAVGQGGGHSDQAPRDQLLEEAADAANCAESDPFQPGLCVEPLGPIADGPAPGEVLVSAEPDSEGGLRDQVAGAAGSGLAPARETVAGSGAVSSEPVSALESRAPDAPERWVDRFRLRCSVTGSTNLSFMEPNSDERGDAKPRVSLGCSAQLTDRLSVRATTLTYLDQDSQRSWDPDYTYAFRYRLTDKLDLSYSNYAARFDRDDGVFAGLLDGTLRANYKLPRIEMRNGKSIACSGSLGLPDLDNHSVNLSCGYSLTPRLRVGGTIYLYPPGAQDTYEPDFSYTASYRFNDKWILTYSNYSNNRWPGNRGAAPGPGLLGGSLSLTYRISL